MLKGALGDDVPALDPTADTSTRPPSTQGRIPKGQDTPPPKNRSKDTVFGQKHLPPTRRVPSTEPENQVRQDAAYHFGSEV